MRHNIDCRLCNEGSYEALDTSHSANLNNLQLGLPMRRDSQPWIVLRCASCGNIQVCDPTTGWWRDKV